MSSTLFAQGVAALRAGDIAGAERMLLAVVERDAGVHEAWHVLSMAAIRAGLPDVAVARAQRAVELDRRNADYLNSLGIAHSANQDLRAAEQAFRRAVKIRPAYAEAHYNLAKVLRLAGELDEALAEYQRAHALEPRAVFAQLGLAAVHRLRGRPDLALNVLRAEGAPDDDIIPYRAECLADVEGPQAAVSWLRELLAREPQNRQAHHILGVLLLSTGDWREGWPHFLWRAHGDPQRMHERPDPLPERLDSRRVFLRAEEGIGDILFYLRFADALRARGASLVLECPPHMAKLGPLLAGRVAIGTRESADIAVWIADLPALLEVDGPAAPFPLRADEESRARARERLASLGPPPYLALNWRAGTDMRRARELGAERAGLRLVYKEIAPELLGGAVRGWRGTLVSLQRGLLPRELDAVSAAAGARVHDLAEATDELGETLAFLESFDEHVAVINTNMHLLAGLGRPARVLVPRPIDWRWMRAGESPWFPGFPVYRQPPSLDWSETMARLRSDLSAA